MKKLGILGGMGPLATADLYRNIVLRTKANVDQEHIHVVIDSNTQIPDRTEYILNQGESPIYQMVESIKVLEAAFVDLIVMPCNTAHYFIDILQSKTDIELLNMVKITSDFIKSKYDDRNVYLLSTTGTYSTKIYEKYNGNIKIPSDSIKKDIMKVIRFVKAAEMSKADEILKNVFKELLIDGDEVFILGCTELSTIYYHFKYEYIEIVDPMSVLIDEILIRFEK